MTLTPLLSVVIANYNYGRFLETSIRSVLDQKDGRKVELIIVDGGSGDESVDIIRKYADRLAWWCSEPDKGQSDAFNKGFAHAKGRFLTWLNADDVLLPGAFEKLFSAIESNPKCEWFIGGGFNLTEDLRVINCMPTRPLSKIRAAMTEIQVYGPSSFFSRELYNRVGGYIDTRFHYLMDIELWNRFYHVGRVGYCRLPGYVWGFRFHSGSKTASRFCNSKNVDKTVEKMHNEKHLNEQLHGVIKNTRILRLMTVSIWSKFRGWLDTRKYHGCAVENV